MSTVQKVETKLNDFIGLMNSGGWFDEDEFFDLQVEVTEIILKEEFPALKFDRDDPVDELLLGAAEDYIGDVVSKLRKKQKPERTAKMARVIVKRGKAVLSRISNKP